MGIVDPYICLIYDLYSSVLEQSPNSCEDQLSDRLHGRALVPSRLLDYAWNHWEDAIDVGPSEIFALDLDVT